MDMFSLIPKILPIMFIGIFVLVILGFIYIIFMMFSPKAR